MVDGNAGQRGNYWIRDSCRVERVWVSNWKKQARNSRQRLDMRRTDRLDADVRVRGRVAGRDGVRVRRWLEGRVSARWRFEFRS